MMEQRISHRLAAGVAALGARVGVDVQPARLLSWGSKGTLAVLDQGLFSGANFLVNILLARWLPPEEYGAFAVALSIFYLLGGLHTAVLTEPMMVFGAGKYRDHFRKYLGILLWGHWAVSALIALALGVAAFVMARLGSAAMAQALTGLAVALPFLLLLWLVRRVPYIEMRPQWAVLGSGVNLLVMLGGASLLARVGLLSSLSGLVLLGFAGGVTSLVLLLYIRPQLVAFAGNPTTKDVFVDHRSYGSWNILAFVAYWASGQILNLLIPFFMGLSASAAFAAIWNLYRPINLFVQSLGLVILPTFSIWINQGVPAGDLRKRILRIALSFGCLVGLYGLALTLGAQPVLHLLYAGKYDEHWVLVGLFGFSSVASVVAGIFVAFLKAQGNTKDVSNVWGISAVLSVIFSTPLIYLAGVEGAILGAGVTFGIAAMRAYRKIQLGG